MNKICIVGNACAAPELRSAGERKFATLNVAVGRSYKNKDGNYDTDFFNVTLNGSTAEYAAKNVAKGAKVAIEGAMYSRKKDNVTYWTLNAASIDVVKPAGGNGGNTTAATEDTGYEDDYEDFGV